MGRERQIRSGRFELLYGYDFFLNLDKFTSYRLYINVGNAGQPNVYNINSEDKYENRSYTTGVAGIGGFKYFIIPRLCFSAEATVNIGFRSLTKTNEHNTYDTSTDEYRHDQVKVTSRGLATNIISLFAVNIGYYF